MEFLKRAFGAREIDRFVLNLLKMHEVVQIGFSFGLKRKPWAGIEPATFALPRQRSGQAELPRHFINKKYEHNLTISIQRYYRTYPGIRISMLML